MKLKNYKFNIIGVKSICIITAVISILCITACPSSINTGSGKIIGNEASVEGKDFIIDKIIFSMKKINTATGIELGHKDIKDNQPYKVNLKTYYIGETEVTKELYAAVIGSGKPSEEEKNTPVNDISWFDAIEFCNKLTEKVFGENECVYSYQSEKSTEVIVNDNKKGFRLPTEAEWEWAAMAKQNYKFAGSNNIDEVAWYDKNSDDTPHSVKLKKRNGYGLYDMTGNVAEWCFDAYNEIPDTAGQPKAGGSDHLAVVRGFSFKDGNESSQYVMRDAQSPKQTLETVGLRLASNFVPEKN